MKKIHTDGTSMRMEEFNYVDTYMTTGITELTEVSKHGNGTSDDNTIPSQRYSYTIVTFYLYHLAM